MRLYVRFSKYYIHKCYDGVWRMEYLREVLKETRSFDDYFERKGLINIIRHSKF